MKISTLQDKELDELRIIARKLDLQDAASLRKQDLIYRILEADAEASADPTQRNGNPEEAVKPGDDEQHHGNDDDAGRPDYMTEHDPEETELAGMIKQGGLLEVLPDGYGFLRSAEYNFMSSADYGNVSPTQVNRFGLQSDDTVMGTLRPPKEGQRYFALIQVDEINGRAPNDNERRTFEDLTPLYPEEQLRLETDADNYDTRIMDLFVPLGKGQRGLIVSPPKAGKTVMLQNIANGVTENYPDAHLMILLVDERPEEVTDMKRNVEGGQVVASTFDEEGEHHVEVADAVLRKAKRLVEAEQDVIILLDSITRLARAHNSIAGGQGRTLSVGIEAGALRGPRSFFGAPRNVEVGGSLTIMGTALIDTGSRGDEVIFEEFKGTGNMEIVLNRKMADRRIYPAIDLIESGTRREELLLPEGRLNRVWILRKLLADRYPDEAMIFLLDKMKGTRSNDEFMTKMNG
jgi:transcription termination factor Rho